MQLYARKNVGQFAPDKVGQFDWIVQPARHLVENELLDDDDEIKILDTGTLDITVIEEIEKANDSV